MSLNDIDAQLAELKARLGGLDSEASDDESGGGAREESRDNDPKRKSKKEKKFKKFKKERKEKKAKRARSSSSGVGIRRRRRQRQRVGTHRAASRELPPEHNAYAAKSVGKRRKQSKAGSPATATAAAAWARGDGTVDAADASRAGASDASPSAQTRHLRAAGEAPREARCRAQVRRLRQGFHRRRSWRSIAAAKRTGAEPRPTAAAREGGTRRRRGAADPSGPRRGRGHRPGYRTARSVERRSRPRRSSRNTAGGGGGKWHKARASGELPPSRKPYNAT